VLANHNAPRQVVISGPTAAVDDAVETLRQGVRCENGSLSRARFTARWCAPPATDSRRCSGRDHADPELPVWSNRTATVYGGDVRTELAAQIGAPVRFVDEIEGMYADGARIFVEAGPAGS